MALAQESQIIDGTEWHLTQLDARRAMRLIPRIGKVLGPALGKAGDLGRGALGDVDVGVLGAMLESFFAHLSPDELDFIVNEMLGSLFYTNGTGGRVSANGTYFGEALSGRLLTVAKLLKWSFEFNFGDFFAVAPSFLKAKAPAATLSPSMSPTT